MIMTMVTLGLLPPVVVLVTMASLVTSIYGQSECSPGDTSYEVGVSYSYAYSQGYQSDCGWFGWQRCTRYRMSYRVAYSSHIMCCPGFSGPLCNEIDECSSNPCMNGGICSDQLNSFSCTCASGWSGFRCQHDVNECLSNPCFNGGHCTNLQNAFRCVCNSGWTGTGCQDVLCPNISWPSPYGIVQFSSGDLYSWSESSGECPWFTVNDGEPIARAVCSDEYISPCAWVPSDNCGGNKTTDQLLVYLRENPMTAESNIQDVLSLLTVISQDTNITSAVVNAAFEIIHQTGSMSLPTQDNVASVVDILSILATFGKGVIIEAEMMNGAVSTATIALENILLALNVPSNQTFQQVASNLVVTVINSDSDGVRDGIVFSIIGTDSQSFDESDIQLSTNNLDNGNLDGVVQAAIVIGPWTIDEGTMGNIAFTVYRDDALFVMDGGQETQVVHSGGSNDVRRNITVNTKIIGASLGTNKTKPLNDPVTITLAHKQQNATDPQCVYWEYSTNAWSSDGCDMTNTSETHTECQCNHLTNFAVLMDVSGIPRRSERVELLFRILSYIGCSLSIVGLLVTLAVYITDRKLRQLQPIKILMCLCITLLFLYIFFIIMTALDRHPGEPEVGPGLCGVIAAILHFTTLSSMSWMGVEGINMFLMVVRVMDSYIPLFMMKATIIAWGLPAAIVLLTGAISRQNYSESDYCFLQKWPLVGGLLIPMAIILAHNVIIFALVMRRLVRIKSSGGKASELKSEARLEIMRRLKNGIAILLILGLTWLVGYFTVIEQLNLAVHVIFILLNSLQGFFIFVFYVLRQPQSRARLREHLGCCFHDSLLTTDAGPISMRQTTTTGTENPINESVLSESDIDGHEYEPVIPAHEYDTVIHAVPQITQISFQH